ncbi:MAG: electron transfer flavoprotein subunit alpha/FixB family protein, partial [Desulfobacteraceae bacterium]|nr:electron transfer flavoprotein subunit alpha/FixB family protein [Desulfobacteraceae bacterium]
MNNDIWIIVQHRERLLEESTFGLVAEARRLLSQLAQDGAVVAVALGMGLDAELAQLGAYGVSRVLYVEDEALASYQGELFSEALFRLLKAHEPNLILMADTPETADLCPRLAGMLETPLVTRVADLRVDRDGKPCAVRPVSNGYLFEEIQFDDQRPLIISFIPSVLNTPDPGTMTPVEILTRPLNVSKARLKTRTIRIIAAGSEDLDLEEADIIVSGGRGVGKDESFEIIHELARTMG